MKINVRITENFEKSAKKLLKKYASLHSELSELLALLETNPYFGIKITEKVYKIRLSVKSKGKGKSGGLRVITYVETEVVENEADNSIIVNLISIYDKSETENISNKEIKNLIENMKFST